MLKSLGHTLGYIIDEFAAAIAGETSPFPSDAFRAESLPRKLTRLFNERSYGSGDIQCIRSSCYISESKTEHGTFNCIVSRAIAQRQDNGKFYLFVMKDRIWLDPLKDSPHIPSGRPSDIIDSIEYDEKDVVTALDALASRLEENAERILANPDRILKPENSIHIHVAKELFKFPRTRAEIMQDIDFVNASKSFNPQPDFGNS